MAYNSGFKGLMFRNISYDSSFNRTPLFHIRGRTFSTPHYHNESPPSFVVASLHQHYDARRHCWASIPCYEPTHPLQTFMRNFTHASTRKANIPLPLPQTIISFHTDNMHETLHVTRLEHKITNLFVIIRLTDTSFFLSLPCSV